MGLLKKYREFKAYRLAKAIAKNSKLIKNPKAIRDERMAALDYFSHLEDPEVVVKSLLPRFEYSLEHGINDSKEKEKAMDAIVSCGPKTLPFIKEHLLKSDRIAWPLKIYNKLASEPEVVELLEECLDFSTNIDFDQGKVDKNYDILCYLRDYSLKDGGHKLLAFLEAHDERVRFAVTEVLLHQGDEKFFTHLEKFLTDSSSENIRIRQATIEHFLENKWTLKNQSLPVGPLIPGIRINKNYQLERSHAFTG